MWLLLIPCIALFVRGAIFGFRLRLRAAQGFIEGSVGDNIKHKNTGNKPRIGAKNTDEHGVLSEPEPGASGSAETPGADGQDAGDDGENAKNT